MITVAIAASGIAFIAIIAGLTLAITNQLYAASSTSAFPVGIDMVLFQIAKYVPHSDPKPAYYQVVKAAVDTTAAQTQTPGTHCQRQFGIFWYSLFF